MRDATAKRLSGLHTLLYRATHGAVGRRLVDNDMLLLTTSGRRTGAAHTVPLLYLRREETLVVFASWGGRSTHPEWYLNLLTKPSATVQVLGRRWPVRARTAGPGERESWFARAIEAYSGYEVYQGRTDREIPVVFLEPV
jgi:deazaflavin-dependent oxidoreductase (nitroreductase family)